MKCSWCNLISVLTWCLFTWMIRACLSQQQGVARRTDHQRRRGVVWLFLFIRFILVFIVVVVIFSGSVICYVAIRLTHSGLTKPEIMRTSRDQPIKSLDSIHVWICMRRCSTIDPPTGALSRCTADTQNQIIVSYGDMSWNVGFELPLAIEALLHCLNYEDTDPVLIIQNVPLVWRVFISMSS